MFEREVRGRLSPIQLRGRRPISLIPFKRRIGRRVAIVGGTPVTFDHPHCCSDLSEPKGARCSAQTASFGSDGPASGTL